MRTVVAAVAFLTAIAGSPALSATTYSASDADGDPTYFTGPGGHSLWFSGGFRYSFLDGATFSIDDSGNARLQGDAVNGAGDGYTVDFSFVPDAGVIASPKKELKSFVYDGPDPIVDTDDWTFFDLDPTKSTLTGLGAFLGLVYDITSEPTSGKYSFQLGIGANGKNINFGLSGWLKATQRHCSSDCEKIGDINIDLAPVPLPASALLLPAALGLMAVSRRRKRKAA